MLAKSAAAILLVALAGVSQAQSDALPASSSEAANLCNSLARRLSHIDAAACVKAGLMVGAHSVHQRPILVRDFEAKDSGETAPRILVIGAIHGDELAAVVLGFDWMQRLSAAPERGMQWRFAPCVNPDGLLARKPTRVNAHGVDLNRNFPTADWASDALSYWDSKTRRDPRRYPGPEAASEPETRWLVAQIRDFHPDAIVTVHAPYGVLDYDGPPAPPARLGLLRLHTLGVYPGSLGAYAGQAMGLPVLTLELPQAARPLSEAESARLWHDLVDWLQHNVRPAASARLTASAP